jgi:spore germination protein YaaH
VLLTLPLQLSAQGLIKQLGTKATSKATNAASAAVSTAKGRAKIGLLSKKRALKRSLRTRKPGEYEENPMLEDIIEDPEVKADLSDNSKKTRYVKLFGHWTTMPNDAELALRAQREAFLDSIRSLPDDALRVTKKIWDGSRDMIVFGWHPYWVGNLYKGYNYDLYNVVSFYSYDINPYTGGSQNPEATAEFLTGEFVKTAQDRGCSALLSLTCHGEANVGQFLNQNPVAQRTVIDSLIYLLDSVKADGIEINFSGVSSAVKNEFHKFVQILSNTILNVRGDTSFVFMSVPPYDEENIYDIDKLSPFVDIFVVRGFDFQETPDGLARMPVAPYNYSAVAPDYDLRSAVEKYVANIGPYRSDRIILSLPNYGTRWVTDGISDEVLDMSLMTYSDIQFDYVMQKEDEFRFPGANVRFDSTYTSHMFTYFDYYTGIDSLLGDVPHNVTIYYDDSTSLRKKYNFIQEYRLGGVGIQSLGYDAGFTHLEDELANAFTVIERPTDQKLAKLNEGTSQARTYGIYALSILLYLAIFLSIGFCAALFKRDIRQALFDSGNFRIFYLTFLTTLIMILGYYLGMFEEATLPLIVGIFFGGIISWIAWRFFAKKRVYTP